MNRKASSNIYLLLVAIIFTFSVFQSCRPEEYIPKPRSYARIDTPEIHTYQLFDREGFPYRFEYPTYANISRDSQLFDKNPDNPYWININIPEMNGTIYISYRSIHNPQELNKLLEDAHFMSFYHTKKADYQNDFEFHNEHGVKGYLYEWGGDAASKYQFVATDSVRHFVRGALYFNTTPNADSLKPFNDFVKKDIQQILQTIEWK